MARSDEVTGSRLVRNTAVNGLASGVVAVLAVLMTPFFLRRLGAAEYGVWLLALSLTFSNGYLGLADLGLQQAGVRLIAEARSRNDLLRVSEVVSTMTVLFAAVGVVLAALLVGFAGLLADIFRIDASLESTAKLVFTLVGVQILLDLPSAAFMSLVEGAQRYSMLRVLDVGTRVVWSAAVAVVLVAGGGAVSMAAVALATAAGALGLSAVFARLVQPELRLSLGLASMRTLRDVVRQGSSLLVLRVTSIVYRQMDRAIVGVVLGAVAVSEYEIVYKIHATAALVLSVAPSAVMPAAAFLNAADDERQLRALYLRGTKYALAFCLPVALASLLYARAILVTWVGVGYESLTGATRLFLIYPVLVGIHVIGVTMLVGLGRMREMVILSPASVALNLVISVVLAPRIGLNGVIWGTLIGYVVIWVPYVRLLLKSFRVSVREWLRAAIVPNIPGAALQIGLGLATLGYVDRLGQLWQVGAVIATSCALSLGCFLFVVLGRDERTSLVGAALRRSPAT